MISLFQVRNACSMKDRRVLILVVLLCTASLLMGGSPAENQLPDAVPSNTAPNPLLDLSRWEGKVVLVDFWASWCVPCQQSFPWMAAMQEKYAARGLVIVAVNLDQERAAADRFLGADPHDFEYIFDPEGRLAEAHALEVMPTSILFDRAGRAVFRHSGFHIEKAAEYESHIVAALEGSVEVTGSVLTPPQPAGRRKVGIRPWQRGLLAARGMALDCDRLDLDFDDHIYFSKEASSGGRGYGGGGCGCN